MSQQIYGAIISIMSEVGSISKEQKNLQQGFKYRGVDDVYNSLHSVMAKHGVFSVPQVLEFQSEERETKNKSVLLYEKYTIKYTFYASDGSSIEAVVRGIGMDSGDKAGNKAMAIAHKYALLQVFCIPTSDTKDPDAERPEENGITPRAKDLKNKHPQIGVDQISALVQIGPVETKQSQTGGTYYVINYIEEATGIEASCSTFSESEAKAMKELFGKKATLKIQQKGRFKNFAGVEDLK